jgi:hypothetical protein
VSKRLVLTFYLQPSKNKISYFNRGLDEFQLSCIPEMNNLKYLRNLRSRNVERDRPADEINQM